MEIQLSDIILYLKNLFPNEKNTKKRKREIWKIKNRIYNYNNNYNNFFSET